VLLQELVDTSLSERVVVACKPVKPHSTHHVVNSPPPRFCNSGPLRRLPYARGLVCHDMGADSVGSFFARRRQGSRWRTTSASSGPGSPTESHLTAEDSKHDIRPYPPPHLVREGAPDLSCRRPRPVVRRITRRRWWRRGATPPSRPVLRQIPRRRCWADSLDDLKDGGRCHRLSLRPRFPLFSASDMIWNPPATWSGIWMGRVMGNQRIDKYRGRQVILHLHWYASCSQNDHVCRDGGSNFITCRVYFLIYEA
jgi:hypothetical protein